MPAKHTPGPWLLADSDPRFVYALGDEGYNRFWLKVSGTDPALFAELEANARLIAAAPELLEVVRKVYEGGLSPDEEDALGALLNRIDGEESSHVR